MMSSTRHRRRLSRRRRFSTFNIIVPLLCFLALVFGVLFVLNRYDVLRDIPVFSKISAVGDNMDTQDRDLSKTQDWNLLLVNEWNPLPKNHEITLTQLQNGQSVDERIYPSLQSMFDNARAAGIQLTISSSYRTSERQQELLDEKIEEYQGQGYSDEEAASRAREWVALPGTSEHELGLAVDITTLDSQIQDASIVWEWLKEHCAEYGFILRYPEDKTVITGIAHEPWHFRYVGRDAAKEIMEKGICLEEYLAEN